MRPKSIRIGVFGYKQVNRGSRIITEARGRGLIRCHQWLAPRASNWDEAQLVSSGKLFTREHTQANFLGKDAVLRHNARKQITEFDVNRRIALQR